MNKTSVVIRTPSGLSGDMLVAGLARLAGLSNPELGTVLDSIGLPALHDVLTGRLDTIRMNQDSHFQSRVPCVGATADILRSFGDFQHGRKQVIEGVGVIIKANLIWSLQCRDELQKQPSRIVRPIE